jgi:uncharacterized protein DUF1579
MKLRKQAFVVCATLLVAGVAAAQDAMKPGEKPMSAEQKAMMEAWATFATPGEGHKALAGMVGTWDAEVTSWMEPGQPPTKSKGTSANRMVLGGRWVESKFTSEMMGQPFEGLGYTGYDNYKKKYIGTWQDNMSTAVMVSEGTFDAAGKVMTSMSTMDDPITRKPSTVKMVTTLISPDHHLFEMWAPGPDGKVYKNMEIHYRRRK